MNDHPPPLIEYYPEEIDDLSKTDMDSVSQMGSLVSTQLPPLPPNRRPHIVDDKQSHANQSRANQSYANALGGKQSRANQPHANQSYANQSHANTSNTSYDVRNVSNCRMHNNYSSQSFNDPVQQHRDYMNANKSTINKSEQVQNNVQYKPTIVQQQQQTNAPHVSDDAYDVNQYYSGIPATSRTPYLCHQKPRGVDYKSVGAVKTHWFHAFLAHLNSPFIFVLMLITNSYHYRVNCIGADAKLNDFQIAGWYLLELLGKKSYKHDLIELYKRGAMKARAIPDELKYYDFYQLLLGPGQNELKRWIKFIERAGMFKGQCLWSVHKYHEDDRWYLEVKHHPIILRSVQLINSMADWCSHMDNIQDAEAWCFNNGNEPHFAFG